MQSANISPCPTIFCQCEVIGNIFSQQQDLQVTVKAYLLIAFIVLIIVACMKLGMEWFIFKDYYPLKQKSPVLCIMLIVSICGQIVLYPMLYISNFFTNMFSHEVTKLKFRSVQSGLQFSVFIIYLIRCLRINYAHETHSSRSKTLAFKLFQKQYLLALCIGFLFVIKAVVVLLDYQYGQETGVRHFALSVELQIPKFDDNHMWIEIFFIYRSILVSFFSHCILTYCMWLHKNVNQRYSMKNQLLLIIIVGIITDLFIIIQFGLSIQFNYYGQQVENLLAVYCRDSSRFYPNTEVFKIFNLSLILWISIIKPLREKKVYHVLLPTGRHYGFIKTMRDFLMQEQFLKVFTKYLQYQDDKNENNIHITLLQFWQKMILLKLNQKQPETQKLESIKLLIEEVKDILFIDQSQLIINLKKSIIELEESITNSDILKQKYRESINEKVDEMEKMALERLDRIYMKSYSKTQSYRHLKYLTQYYKKVNLNMIMLNLALIVDSQNQFT